MLGSAAEIILKTGALRPVSVFPNANADRLGRQLHYLRRLWLFVRGYCVSLTFHVPREVSTCACFPRHVLAFWFEFGGSVKTTNSLANSGSLPATLQRKTSREAFPENIPGPQASVERIPGDEAEASFSDHHRSGR